MIPRQRLENALGMVARRYAPALVPANITAHGMDAADLARRLALEGALVIGLEAADPAALNAWADGLTGLHRQLCAVLFPSFQEVSAAWVDAAPPPIAVITAACAPAIAAIGACIVPYAASAALRPPSPSAIGAVCDRLLVLLEAGDLTADAHTALRDALAGALLRLISLPARPIAFTPPDPALAPYLSAPPPPDLPEIPQVRSSTTVPVFFDPARRADDSPPPPPVPPLPSRLPE